jgi:(4S)-4-hydroxy-5-phosphonooxypentane-2,3-dione isomerase
LAAETREDAENQGDAMIIALVHVHVKTESVDAFSRATTMNASHSVQEPGIARFDVVQQQDDPTRFVLIEAYRNEAAVVAHKETAHYLTWRETVTPMMAEPRTFVRHVNITPDDRDW